MSSDAPQNETSGESTGIIRRHPTGPIPQPLSDDTRTSIIGRRPPIVRGAVPRMRGAAGPASSSTAVAASALAIISGWATSVVATGLITGWWRTDRLFCVGVGFLTAVFGATTITGVVGLLLRRRVGVYLSVVGAALALLIFAGIFVAGAHMAGVVRAFPVLPGATIALAVAPATWRWTKPG